MIEAYFPRTIEILKALKLISIFEELSAVAATRDDDAFVFFAESLSTHEIILHHESSDLIREIISIEFDKYMLRDTSEKVVEIAQKERIWNTEREVLLTTQKDLLKELDFVMNPFVTIYMSDYKIIWDVTKDEFMLKDNIGQPESEHYYVFQQIDLFDPNQSNILEFPLTQYECYILQLFKELLGFQEALSAFKNIFNYETAEEQQVIETNFRDIINYFIYKKFLVRPE
ncbi:MAG: hypothetical protein AAF611_05375 [Bacteroidota bacterium]